MVFTAACCVNQEMRADFMQLVAGRPILGHGTTSLPYFQQVTPDDSGQPFTEQVICLMRF
jgi:hypothetical protein